ncbi:MAG TPA: V-type ATP synthase subunit K [Acholeplasma sp.]|nr:V-type ATP synthase subunit K [Acholeplasma sp.]
MELLLILEDGQTYINENLGLMYALLGVGLAAILAGLGSVLGVMIAGKASAGVLSEKPELFGKLFVLQALPGTQGMYGFLIAVMLMIKLNILSGAPIALTNDEGLLYLAAALPIAVIGLLSAIYQGIVARSSILMTAKQPEGSTKGIMMTVLVETYAILALLVSILMWLGLPGA